MTDPEFAHRTYVEPLTAGVRRGGDRAGAPRRPAADARRPDCAEPRHGLHDDGVLERFGVELIGADYDAIRRAEDREVFRETMEEAGLRVPWSLIVAASGRPSAALADGEIDASRHRPPGLHARRRGRRSGRTETELRAGRLRGPRRQPDQPGPGRGVGDRLGRVRARADARPQRQRRRHLLDRERRPDGRPHRRLGHDRAGADADRPPLPGAPRPGDHASSAPSVWRPAARTSSSRSTRRRARSW